MKTVLITGINGFLGSSLARTLKESYHVIGLEYSLNNLTRIADLNLPVYASENGIPDELFSNNSIDIILHTATFYGRSSESVEKILSANMLMPFQLLDKAVSSGCSLFINTDTVLDRFVSAYALTKRHFQEWLYFRQSEIQIINMQLEHFYGPGASDTNFISAMISRLLKNEPVIALTKGEQLRDFIHVDDVVSAFIRVMDNAGNLQQSYSNFEVATGKLITIHDILSFLHSVTKSTSKLDFGALPYRDNEMMVSNSSNQALRSLGWEPKISIEQGLAQMVKIINSELS